MRRVLILSYSEIDSDPRVLRQLSFFEEQKFDIVLCGKGYTGKLPFYQLTNPKSLVFRAIKLLIMVFRVNGLRIREFLYHTDLKRLFKYEKSFDIILANDAETWPVAVEVKNHFKQGKLIFDAHEHYAKQFSDSLRWTWFHEGFAKYLCEKYIPYADEFLTVSQGIANDYEAYYGVKAKVVLNTPNFESTLKPSSVSQTIQLIHHGIANRSRKIEKMIHMMDHLRDEFQLNLMLMPVDPDYFEELKKMSFGKKVNFISTVPTQNIPNFINQFDVGVFILEPVNFNYANALPNKFFEFIQARLAIAIGPTPEMKSIVKKEQIGIVTDTFDEKDMAAMLNRLTTQDIDQFKKRTDVIAEKYSNSQNEKIFLELIQ